MRGIRLHAHAESDLIDIWVYSFQQWDDVQADKYVNELYAAITSLIRNPGRGLRRDRVRQGYRVLFVKRHAIYYRLLPTTVEVVRILHAQMDPYKHMLWSSEAVGLAAALANHAIAYRAASYKSDKVFVTDFCCSSA